MARMPKLGRRMLWAFLQLGSCVQDVNRPSPARARAEIKPAPSILSKRSSSDSSSTKSKPESTMVWPHAKLEDWTVLARKLHHCLDGGLRSPYVEEVAQHRIPWWLGDRLVDRLRTHPVLLFSKSSFPREMIPQLPSASCSFLAGHRLPFRMQEKAEFSFPFPCAPTENQLCQAYVARRHSCPSSRCLVQMRARQSLRLRETSDQLLFSANHQPPDVL